MYPMTPYGPGYPASIQRGQLAPYDYDPYYDPYTHDAYGSAGPIVPMQGSAGPMGPMQGSAGPMFMPGMDYPPSRGYGY